MLGDHAATVGTLCAGHSSLTLHFGISSRFCLEIETLNRAIFPWKLFELQKANVRVIPGSQPSSDGILSLLRAASLEDSYE